MADTTAIKKGAVIRHNNDLYVVTDFSFVSPGKGSAFTKTKMKSISAGKTIEITYKSGETVDVVQVSRQTMQYLYKNGDMFSFMNKEITPNAINAPPNIRMILLYVDHSFNTELSLYKNVKK